MSEQNDSVVEPEGNSCLGLDCRQRLANAKQHIEKGFGLLGRNEHLIISFSFLYLQFTIYFNEAAFWKDFNKAKLTWLTDYDTSTGDWQDYELRLQEVERFINAHAQIAETFHTKLVGTAIQNVQKK